MQNPAKQERLPEDLRGRRRSRILLAASLEGNGERFKVNLLNLSTTGAQLDAETPPTVGSEMVLCRGELRARGRIVWVNEHRFGMEFDGPIDEALTVAHGASKGNVTPLR